MDEEAVSYGEMNDVVGDGFGGAGALEEYKHMELQLSPSMQNLPINADHSWQVLLKYVPWQY